MASFDIVFGEYVWVKPQNAKSEFAVPFGARIIRTDKAQTLVADDEDNQIWVPSEDVVKAMHPSSQDGVDDMITLGDLQEYAILRNLEKRYKMQQIYTYTGTMLIAINPYQNLSIYTDREINLYRNKKINVLPPHIFAVSDNAFQHLKRDKANQCVVISGESGAGKTESTKLILQYLAAISGKRSWIEQQIIEANPIMEAFGNAKTVRNDNSSRFGKYIDIRFSETGHIQSARIEDYLLEKSRIVGQNKGERNYHIFYCMLEGLTKDERKKLDLLDNSPSKYHYLLQGGCSELEGRNETKCFNEIKAAMQTLHFKTDEVWCIISLLAAILHLGNLEFKSTEVKNIETATIINKDLIKKIASLLGVNHDTLALALVRRTIYAQDDQVVSSLTKISAIEGRDAFVKSLYGSIFVQIVKRLNDSIDKKHSGKTLNTIGVLDIFGFENFDDNSFEQLCINYANENLQQFFVKHIFKMEQAEYENDGIIWQHIDFEDNQEILDVVGMKSVNIMSLIDEESKFPKGTDMSLLEKLNINHGHRSMYVKPKASSSIFGIRHYAGIVMYNTDGFIEKNRDSFSTDLRDMVSHSKNKYLKEIFAKENPNKDLKKKITLSTKFRSSLELLMKTLSSAHPFFIRCIKPNEDKKPNQFDRELCIRQLRYSGMMETARIRRAGYPIRHTYQQFVERYRLFLPGAVPLANVDYKAVTEKICKKMLPANAEYQFGRQKVFLKSREDHYCEMERSKVILKSIVTIQRGFRRVIMKRYQGKNNKAASVIQRAWRAHRARKALQIARHGFHRLAACIVSRHLSSEFKRMRHQIQLLQAHCKGYMYRQEFANKYGTQLEQLKDLRRIRISEEEKLKQSGNTNWKAIAAYNYQQRITALNLPSPRTLDPQIAKPAKRSNSMMNNLSKNSHLNVNTTIVQTRPASSQTEQTNRRTTMPYAMNSYNSSNGNVNGSPRFPASPRSSFLRSRTSIGLGSASKNHHGSFALNKETSANAPSASKHNGSPKRNKQVPIRTARNNSNLTKAQRDSLTQKTIVDLESSKMVDDVFGFLNEADLSSPVTASPGPNVKEKSRMFERELMIPKKIPLKLLSRPVNQYSGQPQPSPRRFASQTRL